VTLQYDLRQAAPQQALFDPGEVLEDRAVEIGDLTAQASQFPALGSSFLGPDERSVQALEQRPHLVSRARQPGFAAGRRFDPPLTPPILVPSRHHGRGQDQHREGQGDGGRHALHEGAGAAMGSVVVPSKHGRSFDSIKSAAAGR